MSFLIHHGDALEVLQTVARESIQCCVTSPPYWGLRDYGVVGQMGLEATPQEYVADMVRVFREVRRVLRTDGTLWLNLGDSYAGSGPSGASYQSKSTIARADKSHDGNFAISKTLAQRGLTYAEKKPIPPAGLKPKDLVGIPWRVAFALQADGWYLRSDIIWAKPAPMPESVRDRPTRSHEYIFLLAKSERYYYDHEEIKEPSVCDRPSLPKGSFNGKTEAMADTGQNAFRAVTEMRNKRDVWTVNTKPFLEAHFATFPEELIEPCILAGCPEGGTVLDPFAGACTTGLVAEKWGRNSVLIELNPEYVAMGSRRLDNFAPLFRDAQG